MAGYLCRLQPEPQNSFPGFRIGVKGRPPPPYRRRQSYPLPAPEQGSALNQVRMFARLLRFPSPRPRPPPPPRRCTLGVGCSPRAVPVNPSLPFTQDVHIRTSASAGFHGRPLQSWGDPSARPPRLCISTRPQELGGDRPTRSRNSTARGTGGSARAVEEANGNPGRSRARAPPLGSRNGCAQ